VHRQQPDWQEQRIAKRNEEKTIVKVSEKSTAKSNPKSKRKR
jgi:hypothetical protein